MSWRASAVVFVAVMVGASGCSGPRRPVELGVKEVASDLLLGAKPQDQPLAPAPVPPVAFTPGMAVRPGFGAPASNAVGAAVTVPLTPPRPPTCPTADPLARTRVPATNRIPDPPAAATYEYRVTGASTVGGASPTTTPLPATSSHVVRDIRRAGDGSFTYAVDASLGSEKSTTTYQVVPPGSLSAQAGLFITSMTSSNGSDPPSTFQPRPALLLLPFPADPATTFTAAGTDGATTVKLDGTIGQKLRVDACGAPLDAVAVHLEGTVTTGGGVSRQDDVKADYGIATQFGGLSIQDSVAISSTVFRGGAATSAGRTMLAVIDREPKGLSS